MLKKYTKKKVLKWSNVRLPSNAVARGLASKKTQQVGVVIQTSPVISLHWLKGIDDVAEMYKYNIVLSNSDEDDDKEVSVVNNLFWKQVDGIIFMGYPLTEKIHSEFSRSPDASCPCWDRGCWTPITRCQYRLQTSYCWYCYTVGKTDKKNCFVKWPIGGWYQWKNSFWRGLRKPWKRKKLSYSAKGLCLNPSTVTMKLQLAERIIASKATAAFGTRDELAAGLLNSLSDQGNQGTRRFRNYTSDDSQMTR